MSDSRITLEQAKKSPKLKSGGSSRITDFLTDEEKLDLKRSNFQGKQKQKRFNDIDAYIAEMIGRFGYEFYKDWAKGEISTAKVNRYIAAERAREASRNLAVEAIVITAVSSCVKREKGQPKPKGMKVAQDIFKKEEKIAKGEF